MNLTPEQRAVVESDARAILLFAGPGSGKTTTLTQAIAHRIRSGQAHPSQVLAMTLTRKAAEEMRHRLARVLRHDAAKLTIGTFHAVCFAMVLRYWERLGFKHASVLMIDERDQEGLLARILKPRRRPPSVTRCKDLFNNTAATGDDQGDWSEEMLAVWRVYTAALAAENAIDYSGVVRMARALMVDPAVAAQCRERWPHLFIDEFQDIDAAQYALFACLAPERIFAVGDPDQLIYGFRGASVSYCSRLVDDFGARTMWLTRNHRSGTEIVEAANRLIVRNDDRPTDTLPTPGPSVAAVRRLRTVDQALDVLARASRDTGRSVAILARTNRQLHEWAGSLEAAGIPCELFAKRETLLSRPDAKNLMAYLVWPELPHVRILGERVCRCEGMTEMGIEALFAEAVGRGVPPLSLLARRREGMLDDLSTGEDLLSRITAVAGRLSRLGLRPDDECMDAVSAAAGQFEIATEEDKRTAVAFASWMAMAQASPSVALAAGTVQLLTIHAAKGLEFDVVLVVGAVEGSMPHGREIREERRVFYVACTRARTALFVLGATEIGESDSRFLGELMEAA